MMPDSFPSPDALRAHLGSMLNEGRAVWIRTGGFSIEDQKAHGACATTLVRAGFGDGGACPEVVVFDWSVATEVAAEGLALFPVVARHFGERGSTVYACEASNASVAMALRTSGVALGGRCAGWARAAAAGQVSFRSVAPAALFSAERDPSMDDYVDGLSASMRELGLPKKTSVAVMGVSLELLQNVLSHGEARNAAAAALLFARRRPRVLQLGVADDGIGIPGSVRGHSRYGWITELSDAVATRTLLRDHISGREESEGSGGGLSRLVQRVLRDFGARVRLCSGSAFLALAHGTRPEMGRLTHGTGTQIRIEFPIG